MLDSFNRYIDGYTAQFSHPIQVNMMALLAAGPASLLIANPIDYIVHTFSWLIGQCGCFRTTQKSRSARELLLTATQGTVLVLFAMRADSTARTILAISAAICAVNSFVIRMPRHSW